MWTGLLDRPGRCGERVHHMLRERRGSHMGDQRWAVANRIREDARLAHAELRAPTLADFPETSELHPEQLAVFRAAARGYVTRFAAPARALDVANEPITLEGLGLGLAVRLPRLIVVEDADGAVEVRRISLSTRPPELGGAFVAALTHACARWRFDSVRVVALNLLTLDEAAEMVTASEADVDVASERLTDAASALTALAGTRRPRPQEDCHTCEQVWNCSLHARER